MAKFSKGDKVESVKTGAKGVVDEVYGDEKYAVLFDGATNPDRVEGFQIKAANGCARNAKFKIGDKVIWTQFGGKPMQIVDMNDKGEYLCRTHDGNEVVFSEEKLKIANSASLASTNAVVQNAINARRARNAEVLDKAFVESKARSIYNDLDDLMDYLKRFAKSGVPAYMLASVQNAMKAIGNI